MNKAVIVFSGGQDSTTCLLYAKAHYDEVHAITFDYGQRHRQEIDVAQSIAKQVGVASHKVMDATLLNELAASALTRDSIEVDHALGENGLPNTFVPGRNILFFTLASIFAYQVGAETIITGVCETDFSGYPDCRDAFCKSLQNAIGQGLDREIKIETPLMWLDKAQTWEMAAKYDGFELVRDQTLTCYNGIVGAGCGDCPSCLLRARGLAEYLAEQS